VRILFSFTGEAGHLEPLVPIARAARAAGHAVAFASHPGLVDAVRARGLAAYATGPAATPGPPQRKPLLEVSMEREYQVLRDVFGRRLAHEQADGVLALCASWRPDVIVRDEVDFGAAVAAERLGLPHASVLVLAAGSFVRPSVVAEPLDALRAAHGLAPDPELAALSRHLVLSPFPPSFRDPAFPLPATAQSLRPGGLAASADRASAHDRATVYVTLGTVFPLESGDLFSRLLAGLRELPVSAIVTVGEHIDPAELGAQPARIRVERYVDQALVLPRCDAVVSHGGSGSVMGALAHGLPSVLLPMGADQPLNVQRCEVLGVARVLDALRATPADVRDAVSTVLAEPGYRRAAARMRAEIERLPGPGRAVELLERLAAPGHERVRR